MLIEKPVWGAPERNKEPILSVIKNHIHEHDKVLEIGSGTGQHIVHFAKHMPKVFWQPTDQADYLPGIQQWVLEAKLANLLQPIELDVNAPMPNLQSTHNKQSLFNLVYTANTLHIMSWETVKQFFSLIPQLTTKTAVLIIYGPFNEQGEFTSASNAQFDAKLKQEDPTMGIRNKEDVILLAKHIGFECIQTYKMPANNQCLIFKN